MTEINPLDQLDYPINLDKYKEVGKIVALALDIVVKACVPGKNICDLCKLGDESIIKELYKGYKKELKNGKGIAYPTCISKNEIVGGYIDHEELIVSEGDLIKIEMGAHMDGFPAILAYTVVVNTTDKPITDERANVIKGVTEASKLILKIMDLEHNNSDVAKILEKCAEKYNCNLLVTPNGTYDRAPGVMSYQVSQNIIDSHIDDDDNDMVHKFILSKHHSSYDFEMATTEFETNEVYVIDVAMSTGEGKIQPMDNINIFRRDTETYSSLKFKASKYTLNQFGNNKFPINMSSEMSDKKFKLGLKECINKNLIIPYPPYTEKSGSYVARVKFTVIVKDNKPILIAARSMDAQLKKIS